MNERLLQNNENRLELREAENRIDVFMDYWKEEYAGDPAMFDKLRHIDSTVELVNLLEVGENDKEVLRAGAKYHDVGRYWQYKLIGSFDDRIISHIDIGADYVSRMIESGELTEGRDVEYLLNMTRYHGKDTSEAGLDEQNQKYVELITAVDRIQNSCLGALDYLEREKATDAKHFACELQMANPASSSEQIAAAMTKVSPEVWEHYTKGETFDKLKLCRTYADYFLFAITLGMNYLQDDNPVVKDLAKKCYAVTNEDGKTVAELYQNILEKHVDPVYADQAVGVLNKFLENSNDES